MLPASAQELSVTNPYGPTTISFRNPYAPTNISGIALWLDAADASTVTGTTSVTKVNDKSGNGVNLSNATGYSYPNNTFNGTYPSFFCPNGFAQGSTATLGYNAAFALTMPFSIFFVGVQTNLSTYGDLCDSAPASGGTNRIYVLTDLQQFNSRIGGGPAVSGNNFVVNFMYVAGTGASATFVNGSSYNTGTVAQFTCSGITVANRYTLNESFPGHICEVLAFNVGLTLTQRQATEGYLAWKWGIQGSLPANHPFKSGPPVAPSTFRSLVVEGQGATVFPLTTILSTRVTKTGFNAQQIAGLQLWLDASDSTTFTFTSDKISEWRDKSTNAFTATQANATYQPVIQTAALNKKNTVNFSLDYMEITQGSAVYPHDCYCVIALKDTTTNVDFIGSSAHFTDNFNSLTFSDYTTSRWQNGSSSSARTPNTVSATNETSTGYLIMRWSIANGNYQLWRNGVQLSQASYTYTQTSGSFFLLGQRSTQYITNLLQGFIAEIQIYTTQLPTGEQQIVEGNLAWKWGLQNSLPSTHPYFRYPPLPYVAPPAAAVIVSATLIVNMDASTYTSGSTWTATVGTNYLVTGTFTTTSTPGGSTAIVLNGSSYAQDQTGITSSTMYLYTLDAWFYSAAGQSASIIGEGGQQNIGGWNVTVISVESNTVSVGFWIGSVYRLSVGSYTANTWTHVAYSYNNTTGAVVGYLNGQRIATGTATKQWPSSIFYTTGGAMNPFGNFTGRIGAFKVYNSVLTDAQVNQNFNALRGRFGI
jgi:hypothetical protein